MEIELPSCIDTETRKRNCGCFAVPIGCLRWNRQRSHVTARDFANSIVPEVEISIGIRRQIVGANEKGGSRCAVGGAAPSGLAGVSGDDPRRRDFPDRVVPGVGDIDIAVGIDRHIERAVESGGAARAVGAARLPR